MLASTIVLSFISNKCAIPSTLFTQPLAERWNVDAVGQAFKVLALESTKQSDANIEVREEPSISEDLRALGCLCVHATMFFPGGGLPHLCNAILESVAAAVADSFASLVEDVSLATSTALLNALAPFKQRWDVLAQNVFGKLQLAGKHCRDGTAVEQPNPLHISPQGSTFLSDAMVRIDNALNAVINAHLVANHSNLVRHIVAHASALVDARSVHFTTDSVVRSRALVEIAQFCNFVTGKLALEQALIQTLTDRIKSGNSGSVEGELELADAFEPHLGVEFRWYVVLLFFSCRIVVQGCVSSIPTWLEAGGRTI
jgi:hypothetical protein